MSSTEKSDTRKSTKIADKVRSYDFNSVIIGIGKLLAVGSIAYSTSVIVLGTEGLTPTLMVIPQAALALGIALRQFTK